MMYIFDNENDFITFGEKVAVLRHEAGMKADHLAAAAGISPAVLSKIENGRYPALRYDVMQRLAKALNTKVMELIA